MIHEKFSKIQEWFTLWHDFNMELIQKRSDWFCNGIEMLYEDDLLHSHTSYDSWVGIYRKPNSRLHDAVSQIMKDSDH